MNKLIKKTAYLFALPIFCFGFSVGCVHAAGELVLEKISDCGIIYMGDSCAVELKITNNTGKILDGTFDFNVQYEAKLFDGEGITAKLLPDIATDEWLDSSLWTEGTVVFTGFDIVDGETFILLEIDTHPALYPGEYDFLFSLKGVANDGEEYVTPPVIAGGGSFFPSLTIINERATVGVASGVIPPNGTAIIKWNTNLLSTSQVIYGLASSDYTLNVDNDEPPYYFGYPMGTDEDKTKVTSHNVLLEGLIYGETYKYRVVSRASPATISYEHTFFVEMEVGELLDGGGDPNSPVVDGQDPKPLAYGNSAVGAGLGQDSGEGSTGGSGTSSGAEEESEGVSDTDTAGTELSQIGSDAESDPQEEVDSNPFAVDEQWPSRNLASVLSAFLENNLSAGKIISILLLLLLLFLIWRNVTKRAKNKGNV